MQTRQTWDFLNPGGHYLERGIRLPGWKTPEISQWSLEGQYGASNNGHRHSAHGTFWCYESKEDLTTGASYSVHSTVISFSVLSLL